MPLINSLSRLQLVKLLIPLKRSAAVYELTHKHPPFYYAAGSMTFNENTLKKQVSDKKATAIPEAVSHFKISIPSRHLSVIC